MKNCNEAKTQEFKDHKVYNVGEPNLEPTDCSFTKNKLTLS